MKENPQCEGFILHHFALAFVQPLQGWRREAALAAGSARLARSTGGYSCGALAALE